MDYLEYNAYMGDSLSYMYLDLLLFHIKIFCSTHLFKMKGKTSWDILQTQTDYYTWCVLYMMCIIHSLNVYFYKVNTLAVSFVAGIAVYVFPVKLFSSKTLNLQLKPQAQDFFVLSGTTVSIVMLFK